jgi:mannitol operon transcriptional antiterminator
MQEGNTLSELSTARAEIKQGAVRNFVDLICLEFDMYPSLNEIARPFLTWREQYL